MSDDLVKRLRVLPARTHLGGRYERDCLDAADAIERLTQSRDAHVSGWMKQCEIATAAIKRAEAAERKVEKLRLALQGISLCSQNSASSKTECGRIAWAALKETEEDK